MPFPEAATLMGPGFLPLTKQMSSLVLPPAELTWPALGFSFTTRTGAFVKARQGTVALAFRIKFPDYKRTSTMVDLSHFYNSKEFQKLLLKGKDIGQITAEEINDSIPANIIDPKHIDEILAKIEDARINIVFGESDDDEEEEFFGTSSESFDEALTAEEKEELRSSSTDPVKLYLKKMGSVALLTREGEVTIAKEIEEGEKEIVLASLASSHAFKEIVTLKDKIFAAEDQNEFVKDLVRGLDDESPQEDIDKTKERICNMCDKLSAMMPDLVNEDGTLKKLDKKTEKEFKEIQDTLVDLTFNRKIINSFVEPVKNYYLQFKELYEQQDRIYKFLELKNDAIS